MKGNRMNTALVILCMFFAVINFVGSWFLARADEMNRSHFTEACSVLWFIAAILLVKL